MDFFAFKTFALREFQSLDDSHFPRSFLMQAEVQRFLPADRVTRALNPRSPSRQISLNGGATGTGHGLGHWGGDQWPLRESSSQGDRRAARQLRLDVFCLRGPPSISSSVRIAVRTALLIPSNQRAKRSGGKPESRSPPAPPIASGAKMAPLPAHFI